MSDGRVAEALRCRLVERCDMVYKKCRWGLLHRQISVFYAGGEYDLCFGAAELLEFVDEVVQFHGGTEGYFDEHGVITGDAVAFDDVGDGLDEGVEVFFLVGFYFQVNKCFYMISPVFSRCSILAETAGEERKTSFAISFTGMRAFF